MKFQYQNLRNIVDRIRSHIEKHTFKVGKLSVRLSSTLVYILCLLGAVFVWVNVYDANAETARRKFDNISVVIEGETALSKNDLAVFDLLDKTVSVTVEGAKNRVDSLDDDDIIAYVDVADVDKAGNVKLAVSVKGADKLDVTVSPSSVKTFIDQRVEIDVPVSVIPTYSIISEYNHVISAGVDSVTISGAKSIAEKVKEARSTPELGELTTSTTASAAIVLLDENGSEVNSSYITSSLKNLVVKVDVFTEKTVPLTYTYKYGYIYDKNIKVTLSPSEITLRGDPTVLGQIENIHLTEIDETKIGGNTEMLVGVKLPSGIVDVNQTTNFSVDIELMKYVGASLEIPSDKIVIKNPEGYDFKLISKSVTFRYIVDSSSEKKVKLDNFGVELDLSNLKKNTDGTYSGYPTVKPLDVGFTLYPIATGKMDVVIYEAED